MILWTIQPDRIYQQLVKSGIYRCDLNQSFMKIFNDQYGWLVKQMEQRIGNPPEGVTYPVWAWYQWEGRRKQPDLRRERWGNGFSGDIYYCLEIDIPDDQVLLSDFDAWSLILSNLLLSDDEREDDVLEEKYNSLDPAGQKKMKEENWQRVFDLTPFKSNWTIRGDSIQATFWQLRYDQIRKVRKFISAAGKTA